MYYPLCPDYKTEEEISIFHVLIWKAASLDYAPDAGCARCAEGHRIR